MNEKTKQIFEMYKDITMDNMKCFVNCEEIDEKAMTVLNDGMRVILQIYNAEHSGTHPAI